ncbi:MFS transporter [Acetomicrobium sp.]|uniref:MFS transporter n=1 Tax=Acetomicrobium sp. TaxID=1872099 RepID=UPI002FCA5B6F
MAFGQKGRFAFLSTEACQIELHDICHGERGFDAFFDQRYASIAVAFPIITSYFMVPLTIAGWIISVYQLGFTVTMPIIGKVSGVFSRKSTFIVCLVLFIVSSAMCAVAKNIEMLIFFRLLQTFGGGGFMPSAVGIISEVFPESRQKMIGLFSSIFPMARSLGQTWADGWSVPSAGGPCF